MSKLFIPCRCLQFHAGASEEKPEGVRGRVSKLKCCPSFWANMRLRRNHEDAGVDCAQQVKSLKQQSLKEEQKKEGELEIVSRSLILREEELFSRESISEEKMHLQEDFTALRDQIRTSIENTFTPNPSSAEHLEVLRSAVASIQQQEQQDQRWTEYLEDGGPPWRPLRFLDDHNMLLQKIVEDRLVKAAEDESSGDNQLSSAVKRQVCGMGKCVKNDLLTVVRMVKDCYPAEMDILNEYARLYHRGFSARLTEIAASELNIENCSYLLLWVNQHYHQEILKHKELDGQINTDLLGPLLQQDHRDRLEEQFLTNTQDKVELWLNNALKKEEESWKSRGTPELLDDYYFTQLAMDVIKVMNDSLTGFNCAIQDQNKAQRFSVHLENFLCSYRKCVEEFVKGNPSNVRSVLKAQLVCEEQLRDYINGQTEILSEEQRSRCLESLSALRNCGYQCFTNPLQDQMKKSLKQVWTSAWVDGSLLVVDSLLEHLERQLTDLTELKPSCRQSLLSVLHQDMVVRYVKRVMKTKKKSRDEQKTGAQRMTEDAEKMDRFFIEESGGEASSFCQILCRLAEIIRLQDPNSVQLELIGLVRSYPDFSGRHVSALLDLKGLSGYRRPFKQTINENRPPEDSRNHSSNVFSRVELKNYKAKVTGILKKS